MGAARRRSRIHGASRGGAMILALGVLAICASLCAAMASRIAQSAAWQERKAMEPQMDLVARGALDWARLILRQDAIAGSVDHLAEPWAIPLRAAAIEDFIPAGAAAGAAGAKLSGRIFDAQGKINYLNYWLDSAHSAFWSAAIQQLCSQADAGEAICQAHAKMAAASPYGSGAPLPRSPEDLAGDLASWGSLDPKLAPQALAWASKMSFVPETCSLNVNTADEASLRAIAPSLGAAGARSFIQARAGAPLREASEFAKLIPQESDAAQLAGKTSTSSNFFVAQIQAATPEASTRLSALLRRSGPSTTIVSVHFNPDLDPAFFGP